MAINSLSTGFRPGVCTSSTRPTAPYEGQQIYETDTDKTLVWNGSAWLYLSTPQTTEIGAWENYTPTMVDVTQGNGTFYARYCRIQKMVTFEMAFTLGSTSAIGFGPIFGLPISARTGNNAAFGFSGQLLDTSAGLRIPLKAWSISTSSFYPVLSNNTTTYGDTYYISSTTPITWATGDVLYMTGTYEAA